MPPTTAEAPARSRTKPVPAATTSPPKPHATFHHHGVTVKPSNLPPALTGFVCDALVLAADAVMAWNFTARFVGHVRLSVGTVLAYDPGLVKKLFDEAGGKDAFRCHGPFDGRGDLDHRALGSATMRVFAGRSADHDYGVDIDYLVAALFAMLKSK